MSYETTSGASSSFIKRRQRDINRILKTLIKQDKISHSALKGEGIDLGCWYGTSTATLRKYTDRVTAIEQAELPTQKGIELGLLDPKKLIIGEAIPTLAKWHNPVDFITFFGATRAVSFKDLFHAAIPLLNPDGFFVLTTIPELEGDVNQLVLRGGNKFASASPYIWDRVGFLYRNS